MSTVIHTYPVPEGSKFTCNLPRGAAVVRAEFAVTPKQVVGGIMGADNKPLVKAAMQEVLLLFVRLDPKAPMQEYSFLIVPDDVPVEEGMGYKASVFSRGLNRFVHVFQSLDPE
jgi:hypothetical protein